MKGVPLRNQLAAERLSPGLKRPYKSRWALKSSIHIVTPAKCIYARNVNSKTVKILLLIYQDPFFFFFIHICFFFSFSFSWVCVRGVHGILQTTPHSPSALSCLSFIFLPNRSIKAGHDFAFKGSLSFPSHQSLSWRNAAFISRGKKYQTWQTCHQATFIQASLIVLRHYLQFRKEDLMPKRDH